MMKKLATGFLAVAATGTLALSLPAPANASTTTTTASSSNSSNSNSYDYEDYWGSYYSKYGLAKARGWIGVDGDYEDGNSVHVTGRLYDLDDRTYSQGGKCAYVKFQAADDEYDWYQVYSRYYCGYPGYKKFEFHEDDVYALRAKVCQYNPFTHKVSKCGKWQDLYDYEEM
ncbi:hypothetical protein ACFXJ8_27690 [Nonomuraea sp. NPDC059194]|uniref:hypothetical protein n=1 Tax=Nonomuraea sp. NPDC059194 TaxID=3346764 RepID=UPI0036A18E00